MTHPSETDLALFAGGECGRVNRFLMNRHIRDCRACTEKVARFEMLRAKMAEAAIPELDWTRLESEMRANIRLGLEAGECVRLAPDRFVPGRLALGKQSVNPRLTVAFASLLILAGAGILMKSGPAPAEPVSAVKTAAEPVLESTGDGLELRSGASSLTLMNRHGAVADQTVSAEGEIRARYVEGGSVTINSAYLE
ncbi:MAG: hypothetical protein KGN84_00530 [Acidobacteriota bacterium]|nr:hypothetical protein [Acidobacteriota bacterium]